MNYKKDIEKLLFDLKNFNIERSKIERDLDYSENYIDQMLAKGGNKKFLNRLKKYSEGILQKTVFHNTAHININTEVATTLSRILEMTIRQQAEINLLKKALAGFSAKDVEKEYDRLFDEYLRQ